MQEIGHAALAIIPTFDGFQRDLERGTSKAMAVAGSKGGEEFGDGFKRGADGKLRDANGKFVKDSEVAGAAAGGKFGSQFGDRAKKAAKFALGGVLLAGAAAFKFGGDSLEEAREAQKVGALTDAVIKSTGASAKVTANDVGNLSERLSNMAGVDDELIQSGANTILTFTKIRNEAGKGNKVFDLATKAALNMSAALKTDLSGASIQVGKALNDPVKGVTALGRAGVQFTTQQKAQIKALVEGGDANAAMALGLIDTTTTYNNLLKANGDDAAKVAKILKTDLTPAQKEAFDNYAKGGQTLEAQKRILKELDTQFAGSAKSQATEADKLSVAFGNLKEEVGTELIPVMDDLAVFLRKKGIPAARDFAGWVKDEAAPAIKDFADDAVKVAKKAQPLIDLFSDLPTGAKVASIGTAIAGGLTIKHQVAKVFDRGGNPFTPLYVKVTNPGGVTDGPGGAGGKTSLVKSLALSGAVSIAVAGAATIGVKSVSDLLAGKETDKGRFGTPGGNNSPLINGIDLDRTADSKKAEEKVVTLTGKVNGLNDALFLVGDKKIRPEMDDREIVLANKRLGEFISKQVDAGRPVTPYIDTTSIERALALVRQLPGAAHGVPTAGTDGGVPFLSGGGQRAGVNFNGPINVQPHDYNDFVKQVERKSQQAGLGGRPQ